MKQIDIFGNEVNLDDIPQPKRGRGKTPTMQERYGILDGKICKECVYCDAHFQTRTWYKCRLWLKQFKGSSPASDIRLRWPACKKFKERTNMDGED